MNVYQTASNHHYYNQHDLLISPSSASSIYSTGQLINDEHFYKNIDNANSSLIHMFINNEERLDRKMTDQFYPNSSSVFTTFNSPSPSSSSFNSSNGSGQMMIMNWTPATPQASCQEDTVVLCQLDELTKNLNSQMSKAEEKNDKIMNQNSEVFYNSLSANIPNVQTQIEHMDQLALTNYEFNSSIISQKLTEANLYNSNRLPNQTVVESLLVPQHHQFNTNANLLQSPTVDNNRNHNISNLHHHSLISTNSPLPLNNTTIIHNSVSPIKSSLVSSMVLSKSTIRQSPYKSTLSPSTQSQSKNNNSPIPTAIKINQAIPTNNQLQQANQSPNNRFPINQSNCSNNKIKQENSTISICNSTTNNNLLSVIIGYDSEGRPIRSTANKKERRRTLSINNAFSNLRDCIPNVPADTKLSKIKTLRLATSYISYLMELLDDSAPINSKRRLMMPDDFKVDLQRFKGRSKNSIHLIYPSKFSDKQFNQKSTTTSCLESANSNLSNQSYLTQQTTIQTFHQTSLTSSTNCLQDTIKYEENKMNNCNSKTSTIHHQQITYNQLPTLDTDEQYDQTNKRIKGRTGWPQHVIKNVWASETI